MHTATFEAIASHWTRLIGVAIESFGVAVIVIGIGWSTYVFARDRMREEAYGVYKVRIGRTLLLGLELLVAADIVKTIALELTYLSLALLAGLILIRTFLSWTLVLEIEGRWPWQHAERQPPSQ
ncbi:MAG: DUF1622 domain-containing protein [Xanthobacteraceae bacterium]|nr:DUF1622 domain-containing protein [Xanthobacteraceae bacterium]